MTQIMMEEVGFIIDEVLEDCKRQHAELRLEKDRVAQHSSYINLRKKENNKLKEETKIATREFTTLLREWLESLSDEEKGEVEITNTARIITQFLEGTKIDTNEAAVYEEEIKRLPNIIRDKYHNLLKSVDKLHSANPAESYDEKGLATYIENQERMYGTLENRVKPIENKKKLFTHLNKEAEETRTS